jgi:hypothetical protein
MFQMAKEPCTFQGPPKINPKLDFLFENKPSGNPGHEEAGTQMYLIRGGTKQRTHGRDE